MILESHELLCDHINQEEEAIIITPTIVDSIPILVILHTGGSDSSQILPVLPNPIKRVSKNPINMKNVGSKTYLIFGSRTLPSPCENLELLSLFISTY